MVSLFALMIAAQNPMPVHLASSPTAADTETARRNQILCRQRPVTGSRLRFTRVCMTRQEWDVRREQITRGMRDMTTREMASQAPPAITPGSE